MRWTWVSLGSPAVCRTWSRTGTGSKFTGRLLPTRTWRVGGVGHPGAAEGLLAATGDDRARPFRLGGALRLVHRLAAAVRGGADQAPPLVGGVQRSARPTASFRLPPGHRPVGGLVLL